MAPAEFQSKITNAARLDFGTVFNHSIELFKKSWLQGFLLQLFSTILILPFVFAFYVPFLMLMFSQAESGIYESADFDGLFGGFSAVFVIIIIVGIFFIGMVQLALISAFYRILRRLDSGLEVKTKDLFYFLKRDYLGKLFLIITISILIAIPAALLFYLPLIYVIVPLSFITVVFAFNPEWTLSDIISSSFRLGNKRWFLTFGLLVVTYILMTMISMISCGLGSLFLSAFLYHPLYFIYKETIGFDDANELDQIGKDVMF